MVIVFLFSEAATRGVLCEKVFLEISQNSQENTFFAEHLWTTAPIFCIDPFHIFHSRAN